jgi:hypothetical protein
MPGEAPNVPDDMPPPRFGSDSGWGFAILAAVIIVIIISWGWSGQGRGWGTNPIAHMKPPVSSAMNGPATRAWMPPRGR